MEQKEDMYLWNQKKTCIYGVKESCIMKQRQKLNKDKQTTINIMIKIS